MDLVFIKELINGPLEDKTGYPYQGRGEADLCTVLSLDPRYTGPEKFFLYEVISNKLTGVDVDKVGGKSHSK